MALLLKAPTSKAKIIFLWLFKENICYYINMEILYRFEKKLYKNEIAINCDTLRNVDDLKDVPLLI